MLHEKVEIHPNIGVGILILRGKRVLMGCRKGPRSAGYFGLPGGYLELHESFRACAQREIFEETGLTDLSLNPFFLISVKTQEFHCIDMIFLAFLAHGEPIVREPHRVVEWLWYDFNDLPSPLYPPSALALWHYHSKRPQLLIRLFLQKLRLSNDPIIHIDLLDEFNETNYGSSNGVENLHLR